MRRNVRIVPVLLGALLALVLFVAPAESQNGGAKLRVSATTEPPDTQVRGGRWRVTVTVSNEGTATSSSERLRFFLSSGRRFSADDLQRRLGGTVTLRAIRRGRQLTRRVTVIIPPTIQDGEYYLVTCLGQTTVNTDNLRCRFSGQTMRIGADPNRAQNVQPGPPGPEGPAGKGLDMTDFGRTSLRAGTNTIDAGEVGPEESENDGNEIEGSTEEKQLGEVGPFQFRALCRDEGSDGEGDDEAKILVYLTEDGTFNFQGDQGPRFGIPEGRGEADNDSVYGGEGKHQIIAVQRDTQDEGGRGGFQASTVVITSDDGDLITFTGYAGIDTLGIGAEGDQSGGDDECVFGGTVTRYHDAE